MIEMIDGKHYLCDCSMADYHEREHYMNHLGTLDDSGEPKAVKSLCASLCVLSLMGGWREMKPVSAAAQTALQI